MWRVRLECAFRPAGGAVRKNGKKLRQSGTTWIFAFGPVAAVARSRTPSIRRDVLRGNSRAAAWGRPTALAATALLALLAPAPRARAGVEYTLTHLGYLNDRFPNTYVGAINDSGQIAGWSNVEDGYHAYRSDGGALVDLGTLGGPSSEATAINESGQTVGRSDLAGAGQHAFRTDAAGVMTDLGSLNDNFSYAFGINAAGEVVGASGNGAVDHAFRTDAAGVMRDMGTLGGPTSSALAINDSGQVVGFSDVTTGPERRAFRADAAGVMTDLGTLGGPFSDARAINAGGQVAGFSNLVAGSVVHAFRTDAAGVMTDLGTLDGMDTYALGINDAGDVVGQVNSLDGAFLFTDARGMVYLDTLIAPGSGWHLTVAADLNNFGQIVGYGTHDGRQSAFLLTPVPEPSSAFLGAASAALALLRRRVRKITAG